MLHHPCIVGAAYTASLRDMCTLPNYNGRFLLQLPIAKVRFVAVSATIPNIQDIASWLQVPIEGVKAFGEEVRPVKLRTVVKGYATTKTDFLFERRLNDYIFSVVAENSKSKPALVFCR